MSLRLLVLFSLFSLSLAAQPSTNAVFGIGVTTGLDTVSSKEIYPKIVEVMSEFPADMAGLKPGDRLLKLDGVSLKNINEFDIRRMLNGLDNVTLEIVFLRGTNTITTKVKRDLVKGMKWVSAPVTNGIGEAYVLLGTVKTLYKGNFANSLPDGQGVATWYVKKDTLRWEGLHQAGMPVSGKIYKNNKLFYEGGYGNSATQPLGNGTEYSEDGRIRKGTFDRVKDGVFTVTDAKGKFINKELWVKGEYRKNSDVYARLGECLTNNCFHNDTAIFAYFDGRRYEGAMHDGVLDGKGTMRFPNGDFAEQTYLDNLPIATARYYQNAYDFNMEGNIVLKDQPNCEACTIRSGGRVKYFGKVVNGLLTDEILFHFADGEKARAKVKDNLLESDLRIVLKDSSIVMHPAVGLPVWEAEGDYFLTTYHDKFPLAPFFDFAEAGVYPSDLDAPQSHPTVSQVAQHLHAVWAKQGWIFDGSLNNINGANNKNPGKADYNCAIDKSTLYLALFPIAAIKPDGELNIAETGDCAKSLLLDRFEYLGRIGDYLVYGASTEAKATPLSCRQCVQLFLQNTDGQELRLMRYQRRASN